MMILLLAWGVGMGGGPQTLAAAIYDQTVPAQSYSQTVPAQSYSQTVPAQDRTNEILK